MRRKGKRLTQTELSRGGEAGSRAAMPKFECEEKAMVAAPSALSGRGSNLDRGTLRSPICRPQRGRALLGGLGLCYLPGEQPHEGTRTSKTRGVQARLQTAKEYRCVRDDFRAAAGSSIGTAPRGLRQGFR